VRRVRRVRRVRAWQPESCPTWWKSRLKSSAR